MKVAKYDINPNNPHGRETLRFHFSEQELDLLASAFGHGNREHLRFLLEVRDGCAMLVPTLEGGMKVTHSPSGKNFPWEVGFNHKSSPDIVKLPALSSREARLTIRSDFANIEFSTESIAAAPRRISPASFRVNPQDAETGLKSLQTLIRSTNSLAKSLGAKLEVAEGEVRAYLA